MKTDSFAQICYLIQGLWRQVVGSLGEKYFFKEKSSCKGQESNVGGKSGRRIQFSNIY